jgi:bacterioferritin-associated ferredoxin
MALTTILIFTNVLVERARGVIRAMYVCICNGITDKQIRAAAARGVGSLQELRDELGVASQCGGCSDHALSILENGQSRQMMDSSLFYSPA